jgi:hypothetical protein
MIKEKTINFVLTCGCGNTYRTTGYLNNPPKKYCCNREMKQRLPKPRSLQKVQT